MDRVHINFLASALLLVLIPTALNAQREAGSITGLITDSSQAAVPGARIVVTDLATGVERNAISNEVGLYVITALPASRYSVSVAREGFTTAADSGARSAGRPGGHRQHGANRRQRRGSGDGDSHGGCGGHARRLAEHRDSPEDDHRSAAERAKRFTAAGRDPRNAERRLVGLQSGGHSARIRHAVGIRQRRQGQLDDVYARRRSSRRSLHRSRERGAESRRDPGVQL